MTVETLTLELLWSLAVGGIVWIMLLLATQGTFGLRLNPLAQFAIIGIVTVVSFVGSAIFDVTTGLQVILTVGFVSTFTLNFNLFTMPFILAAWTIVIALFVAIAAAIVRTVETVV